MVGVFRRGGGVLLLGEGSEDLWVNYVWIDEMMQRQ